MYFKVRSNEKTTWQTQTEMSIKRGQIKTLTSQNVCIFCECIAYIRTNVRCLIRGIYNAIMYILVLILTPIGWIRWVYCMFILIHILILGWTLYINTHGFCMIVGMYYVGLTDSINIDIWSTSIYLSLCPSVYPYIYLSIYIYCWPWMKNICNADPFFYIFCCMLSTLFGSTG